MNKSIVMYLTIVAITIACNAGKNLVSVEPKSGNLVIPSKGELRVWNHIKHPGFDVVLTNDNEK